VALDDRLCDCEADAAAAVRPVTGAVGAVEALEDACKVLRGDSLPAVADGELDSAGAVFVR
jgi:hypothetical protein